MSRHNHRSIDCSGCKANQRVVDAARAVVAAQYRIHLGTVGNAAPEDSDFMPMIRQDVLDELRAALDALP